MSVFTFHISSNSYYISPKNQSAKLKRNWLYITDSLRDNALDGLLGFCRPPVYMTKIKRNGDEIVASSLFKTIHTPLQSSVLLLLSFRAAQAEGAFH